jgi:hypothetical protein
MHFIHIFNSQRNGQLRKKIISVLLKTNFDKDLESVRNVINDIKDPEDVHKFKNIIGRYVTQHRNKKQMIEDISKTYFNFDKVSLEKLRGLPQKDINKQLHKLSIGFIKIGTPKITKFPNMFVACNKYDKMSYCAGDKLIIEKAKLDVILDIIASDMANPAKWKWLFNSVFVERIVEYFRFIKRKNETITIEFVE